MTVICKKCGYERPIQNEYEDYVCLLCGEKMEIKDETQNETEGMNDVIDNNMINAIIREIEMQGELRAWENINTISLEKRIDIIAMFIEAKRKLGLKWKNEDLVKDIFGLIKEKII